MIDYSKYNKIPVEQITSLDNHDVVQIYRNYWWVVTPDDCVLVYGETAPQCNLDKSIVERIMIKNKPECRCVQLPLAFIEWDTSERY